MTSHRRFISLGLHHLRVLSRDRTLWIALAILAFALAQALWVGVTRLKRETNAVAELKWKSERVIQRNQSLAAATERRMLVSHQEEQYPPPYTTRHPVYAGAWSRPAGILPPSPIGWLAVGATDLDSALFIGPDFAEQPQIANPLQLLAGHDDLAFVVYFLPIVLIILTSDLIASDRDHGLLSLAISQPIHWQQILLARATAVGTVVSSTFLAVLAGGMICCGVVPSDQMLVRLLAWIGVAGAYGLFWLGLAVALNARGIQASTNAAVLAAVWLGVVLLIPFTIAQAASWCYPTPQPAAFEAIERTVQSDIEKAPAGPLLHNYLLRHPELANPETLDSLGRMYLIGAARREEQSIREEDARNRLAANLRSQEQLVHLLSFLSPALLCLQASAELAGASHSRYLSFAEQSKAFDAEYTAFFNRRKFALPYSVFTAADYNLIPRMQYREEPLRAVLSRVLRPALGLALYAITSVLLSQTSVRLLHRLARKRRCPSWQQ